MAHMRQRLMDIPRYMCVQIAQSHSFAVVLLKIRAMAAVVAENRVEESLAFYLNKLEAKIEDSR